MRPNLGIRVRLATKGAGHWQESGGDKTVFGLNAPQIIEAVDQLKTDGYIDCLQMLHYHLGSQIPNIRAIREASTEAARIYVDLVREGAPMGILDIGGGLAVDYDGLALEFPRSSNYAIDEYCADVVEVVMQICDERRSVAHPDIITESGRAVVAYYSVLVFNILDVLEIPARRQPCRESAGRRVRARCATCSRSTASCGRRTCRNATTTRSTTATRSARCTCSATCPCASAAWRRIFSGTSSRASPGA